MNGIDHDTIALDRALKAIRDGLFEIQEAEARVKLLQDVQDISAEDRAYIGFQRIEASILSSLAYDVARGLKAISETSIAVNDDLKRSLSQAAHDKIMGRKYETLEFRPLRENELVFKDYCSTPKCGKPATHVRLVTYQHYRGFGDKGRREKRLRLCAECAARFHAEEARK